MVFTSHPRWGQHRARTLVCGDAYSETFSNRILARSSDDTVWSKDDVQPAVLYRLTIHTRSVCIGVQIHVKAHVANALHFSTVNMVQSEPANIFCRQDRDIVTTRLVGNSLSLSRVVIAFLMKYPHSTPDLHHHVPGKFNWSCAGGAGIPHDKYLTCLKYAVCV